MTSKKRNIAGFNIEEVADDIIVSIPLSKKQQHEASLQLTEARKKAQSELSDDDRLVFKLLQLRFKLEDYINNDAFNAETTFAYFLSEYLKVIKKKRNEFAKEIDIHETLLSQLLNNKRQPNESILVRLELHSNNAIPADYWYKLLEKEKENYIRTNSQLRKDENKFVKKELRYQSANAEAGFA